MSIDSLTETRRNVNPGSVKERLAAYRDRRPRKVRKDKGSHRWTREGCLEALSTFVDEHGQVSRDEYERLRTGDRRFPNWRVLTAFFGGYRKALMAADLAGRKGARWEREDVDFLKERAGTMTINRMAQRLGRTRVAVDRKMYLMGIQHKDNDGRYTARELANDLDISSRTVISRVRRGLYKGQKVGGCWRITHPDEVVLVQAEEEPVLS